MWRGRPTWGDLHLEAITPQRRNRFELIGLGLSPDIPHAVTDDDAKYIFLLDHALDELVEALLSGILQFIVQVEG